MSVRTFTKLSPWAETTPWDCLIRPTRCCSPTHDHSTMVGDPCAVPECAAPLVEDEVCYAVTELDRIESPPLQRQDGPVREQEQWVCWRHVRPDQGPIRAAHEEIHEGR